MSNKTTWIRPSRGEFFFAVDKERKNPFTTFDGTLDGINFKDDEYKGATFRSVYISFNTKQGKVVMSLRLESSYVQNLLGFLGSADVTKEMTISIDENKIGDFMSSAIFVEQDGTYLKSIFAKGGEHELPAWEKHVINGKTIWDKSAAIAKVEEVVLKQVVANLPKTGGDRTEMPEFPTIEEQEDTYPDGPSKNIPVHNLGKEKDELPTGEVDINEFKL